MKPKELKLNKKKLLSLTLQQSQSLKKLEQYGVNVSQFIRDAIKEKIHREWPEIKERKNKEKLPF